MSVLYIVSTPLGNLEDISYRALQVLRTVDVILCENTQVSKKLLFHFGISKPLFVYHQHSKLRRVDFIFNLLRKGKNLALICDAGTPGISDPGNQLIKAIVSQYPENLERKINIVPIPGPSALTAIASVCGFAMDRFLFLGFPPAKKKRKQFFEEIMNARYPVIFYESPYRILKTLRELNQTDKSSLLQVVVGRELTKKFETIYRGSLEQVIQQISNDSVKGEFVVVVSSSKNGL